MVFTSIEFRLCFSQVLTRSKKRNAMRSLSLSLSLCPLPVLFSYIKFVVTTTREMWRNFFCRKRRDDEEMEIVEEWLGSSSSHERTPIHTSIIIGKKHVEELVEGHKVRARREFRMEKEIFGKLVEVLHDSNLLANSRKVSVEEQLAMFLFCLSTNASYRSVQERFQHSGEIVS
jgi:hypothetical protein